MRVGLDFDNTIVCYDEAFYQLAREHEAVPKEIPHTKEHVKAYLQAQGKNVFWTWLQGIAYGPRMESSSEFPGVHYFIQQARKVGVELFIVSHRSPKPYSGDDFDLHAAARSWLSGREWVSSNEIPMQRIFFESTKSDKIERIRTLELDYFIDDLMEIFNDPEFPKGTKKIHFHPSGTEPGAGSSVCSVKSWAEILKTTESLWNQNTPAQ